MRPLQQFIRYAIPSVIAMWVFSIYTMADGIFVARGVGETALAAVNIAMPFINAIFAVSLWLAVGASTLIAMALGENNIQRAKALFTMNTVVLTVLSLVFTVLAYRHLDQLAAFLGATEHTEAYVKDYLRIIILFSGFFIVSYSLEVLVKTDGFPILATAGVCLSAISNIFLDYLMVIRWGLGVQGAALATGLSQVLLLVLFLTHFLRRRSSLSFVRFQPALLASYKRILPIGFSDCITEFSTGLVTFMFNRTILAVLGEDALISYTIITYVNTLALMTMLGITQGMQPLVSFACGQHDRPQTHRLLRYGLLAVLGAACLAFALCQALAAPLAGIFIRPEHQGLLAYSIYALRLFAWSFLFLGFNVVIAGFFAAIARPAASLTISLSRGLLLVPIGLALSITLGGPDKLWLATAISEGLTFLATIWLTARYLKRARLIEAAQSKRR